MTWILDLDGVVWLADRPIAGSPEAVTALGARGDRVIFTTNNSYPTVGEYVAKLGSMGVEALPDDMITSAQAAATLVSPGEVCLYCAGPGVEEALTLRGVESYRIEPGRQLPRVASAVIVGFHLDFGLQTVSMAASAVRGGARLIGTNDDATYPTPSGLIAGTGALLAAVATAAGVHPAVAGKPHDAIVALVTSTVGDLDTSIVVGDRPATDGLLARRLGCHFGLVESGVTPPGTPLSNHAHSPDLVAPDLASMVSMYP